MSVLRPLESFIGMLHCLFGMLVSGLVIFFPVVHGGSTVRVCGEFVEFGSFLVRVFCRSVSHPQQSLHLRIFAFSKLFTNEPSRRAATLFRTKTDFPFAPTSASTPREIAVHVRRQVKTLRRMETVDALAPR
jgi:hypothetical protein